MFGSIRLIFTVLIISSIAGAGMYVMKLRSDNAILKANQIQLETAITEQNKVLEQQKADFEAIMESNKKLNVLIQTFKKDLDDLDKRFNKKKRDVGKLAIAKTKAIELREDNSHGLRVKVVGGGCSGFMYELGFDDGGDADKVVDVGGIDLIVDNRSILYLAGSAIDFEGGLNGTGFKIVNPNANSTCGCGESFTV